MAKTSSANLNTFPRSFGCVAAVASNVIGARSSTVSLTGSTRAVQPMPQWNLHLAEVRMSQSCRRPARTAEGTGWNAEQGLVRCAEAGQDSLGINGRSTGLRSQR